MPVRRDCGLAGKQAVSKRLVSRCETDQGSRSGGGGDGRLALKDDDTVGEVGGHDEIVLDDEGRLLRVHDEALDDAGRDDTLLGVEVPGFTWSVHVVRRQDENSTYAEGSSMR